MANRKLIRPNLAEIKERLGSSRMARRRPTPPEETHAESFYYLKQMNSRTPMVVMLTDGEQLTGTIEWYDKDSIKLNRPGKPNLLLLKHCIKYMYKQSEGERGNR
jgi:sRNA-binding regulator protein Hfq